MNAIESRHPPLRLIRCLACCGARLKVEYVTDRPNAMERAVNDMEVLVNLHRCALTDSQLAELEVQ